MGSISIDTSLANIWKSWYAFRKGKRITRELDAFQYALEENLAKLHKELVQGTYRHGTYTVFTVTDSKRRTVSMASVWDRVVHRLVYEHLTAIYDRTFIFDVWSCRKGKGLAGAITRTQSLLAAHPDAYIWRADIKKFFDNVDHGVLYKLLQRKVTDPKTLTLLKEIIASYWIGEDNSRERERERERVNTRHKKEESPSAILRAKYSQIFTCMN